MTFNGLLFVSCLINDQDTVEKQVSPRPRSICCTHLHFSPFLTTFGETFACLCHFCPKIKNVNHDLAFYHGGRDLTIRPLAVILKPLKLGFPNFIIFCFYIYLLTTLSLNFSNVCLPARFIFSGTHEKMCLRSYPYSSCWTIKPWNSKNNIASRLLLIGKIHRNNSF